MISFPLIERVTVNDYDLYPGPEGLGGLDLTLGPGPWLVLGVNGLGKSTLLLLMRYLLAGPVRTRTAGFAGERDDLQAVNNRFFAVRVLDGAQKSTAGITARFGDVTIKVRRSLANLAIISASVETSGVVTKIDDENSYRSAIVLAMGVAQYEDAIRVFDHLTFYLEGRQALIWDGPAQFELFRALLTPNLSAELRRLEGEIVSADSTARNLSAALFKLTQRREKEVSRRLSADDTRARIAASQGELDALAKTEFALIEEIDEAEVVRADYNLQLKRGEQSVDDAGQAYEKLKFEVLRQAFAGVRPTEQYVFLKLLSDKICIACNSHAPEAASELQARHDSGRCVICGSPRNFPENIEPISDLLKSRSVEAYAHLEKARREVDDLKEGYFRSVEHLKSLQGRLSVVRSAIEQKQGVIRRLRKNLPAEENLALSKEEDRISTLRAEVMLFRRERETAEASIDQLLTQLKQATERVRVELEQAFDAQAAPYFAESVRLIYSPRSSRIGQGGRSFEFPAFEVEMTSGATLSQFIRRTPDQVSLSQREYLDLIFRMILIQVLGRSAGTLVVDGPEGSLDAVFAGRAGDLFSRFARSDDVNVILACNIVEGDFIPHTLGAYQEKARAGRIVNLLEQAIPTQALVTLRPLYQSKIDEILGVKAS